MIVELVDFGDVERVVNKMLGGVHEAHPRTLQRAFTEIAIEMQRATADLFKSQGRRGGGSWKKLAESTVNRKGNTRILFTKGSYPGYKSGEDYLYGSLTNLFHRYSVVEYHDYELEFGTDRPYAWTHMVGYGKIPARPFLKFTASDVRLWKTMLTKRLLWPFFVRPSEKDIMKLF